MDDIKYDSVIEKINFIDGVYQSKKKLFKEKKEEVLNLETDSIVLEKTEKILKYLMDKFAKEDLSKIDKLVTYGLATVFPDREITFESDLVEHGSKMRINLNTKYKDKSVDPSSQGSVTVIESFLLRILCIMKLKKAPFLYMDEPFGAVDSEYAYKISPLISELTKKLKMDVLLVTHNPTYMQDANKSYRLKLIKDNLTLETLK